MSASLYQDVQKEFSYIQKIRRQIHQFPEIGFEVYKTAALVAQELESFGLKVKTKVGHSGVVADLEVPGAARRIALRADMDALPMQEEGTAEYRSQVHGKAHMCGHDVHTAMLVGAAKVLATKKNELKAHVRFIFQPNEENYPGGAPGMIDEGALLGVDEIFGMHVWPLLPMNHIGLVRGPAMGRTNNFQIKITGRGGHASMPSTTIDPIVIGAQVVTALQSIVSRQIHSEEAAVISVTQFHAGTTHNVIPETAFLEGTFRTFNDKLSDEIQLKMEQITKGLALSFGAQIEITFEPGYPVLVNHDQSVSYVEKCAKSLYPEKTELSFAAQRVLGGEDFAYFLNKIPGCYVFLGTGCPEKGLTHVCHHPKFDIDEQVMILGSSLHAQLALQFQ